MAKRYHQSVKSRMAESRGMEKAMHSDYADYDSRRSLERKDYRMISEDHNAPANLPQQPIMKYWDHTRGYMPEVLDDTIHGIDSQINADNNARSKGMNPHKF